MSNLHVSSLHTYPVKSCAPAEGVTEHTVTDYGLEYDREWAVARPNGTIVTQRNFPTLATVQTQITESDLHISVPEFGAVRVPLQCYPAEADREFAITLFKKEGSAITQGYEAAEFFSELLSTPTQLLRNVAPRDLNPSCHLPESKNKTRFADGFPFLLTTTTSLELLQSFSDKPITMDRFRPNIVVSGDALQPFEEDYWREARIGTMTAFLVRACARCPIPDVDQSSGTRVQSKPVSGALGEIRSGIDIVNDKPGVFFGQNVSHESADGISLRVGDAVTVTDSSPVRSVDLQC